jgi:hypothetical protein
MDYMELTDIYRISYLTAEEYISFSAAHETFSKRDHSLEHKSTLGKCKKTEITPCIFIRLQWNETRNQEQKNS